MPQPRSSNGPAGAQASIRWARWANLEGRRLLQRLRREEEDLSGREFLLCLTAQARLCERGTGFVRSHPPPQASEEGQRVRWRQILVAQLFQHHVPVIRQHEFCGHFVEAVADRHPVSINRTPGVAQMWANWKPVGLTRRAGAIRLPGCLSFWIAQTVTDPVDSILPSVPARRSLMSVQNESLEMKPAERKPEAPELEYRAASHDSLSMFFAAIGGACWACWRRCSCWRSSTAAR